MELSLRRYQAYLFFQLFFLFVDLVINSYSYLAKGNKLVLIFLFLWVCGNVDAYLWASLIDFVSILINRSQDICLILSLVTFFFGLYSTYVYQVNIENDDNDDDCCDVCTLTVIIVWTCGRVDFYWFVCALCFVGWPGQVTVQPLPDADSGVNLLFSAVRRLSRLDCIRLSAHRIQISMDDGINGSMVYSTIM